MMLFMCHLPKENILNIDNRHLLMTLAGRERILKSKYTKSESQL